MRYYGYNITFCLTPTIEGNTTYDEKVALNDVTIDSACSTTLSLAYNNAQGQTIYTDSLENRVSY
ncbi:MAG: hypothetical protein MJ219_04425 [Mycoplasmoidaceae bacterium]|nr:hypothetical protein [Mycoplasmoidaceae bacterium]